METAEGLEGVKEQVLNGYQVMSDGKTLWINGPQGESVARFTANQYLKLAVVDVHADIETQRITGEQCLACEHGEPTREIWERFKAAVLEHYGLKVPEEHKPSGIPAGSGA
jgi:hypothetical protein